MYPVGFSPKCQVVFPSVKPFVDWFTDSDAVFEFVSAIIFLEFDVVHRQIRGFSFVAAMRTIFVLARELVSLEYRAFQDVFFVDPFF